MTSFNFSSDRISNPPADVTCHQLHVHYCCSLAHLGELDIVLVELLLHDLLENLECELVCLEKGHLLPSATVHLRGTHLVIRVLELLLSCVGSRSNRLGIVSGECTRWVSVVSTISSDFGVDSQLRTLFIDSSNQQCHPEWSRLSLASS